MPNEFRSAFTREAIRARVNADRLHRQCQQSAAKASTTTTTATKG